jgi:hypothetical protein
MTPVVASGVYAIRSLTSRISELRRLGLTINATWKRDAYGRRYRSYSRGVGYVETFRRLVREQVLERQ